MCNSSNLLHKEKEGCGREILSWILDSQLMILAMSGENRILISSSAEQMARKPQPVCLCRGTWHMKDHVPLLQRLKWGALPFANLRYSNKPGQFPHARLGWMAVQMCVYFNVYRLHKCLNNAFSQWCKSLRVKGAGQWSFCSYTTHCNSTHTSAKQKRS